MNRPPLEEVKRGSKSDQYQYLFKIDYAKVLRAVKLPILLIIYGWIGVSLLGVLIKALIVLEDMIKPVLLGSIVSTTIFAVIALLWLYIWRKIAVYYRNKSLEENK